MKSLFLILLVLCSFALVGVYLLPLTTAQENSQQESLVSLRQTIEIEDLSQKKLPDEYQSGENLFNFVGARKEGKSAIASVVSVREQTIGINFKSLISDSSVRIGIPLFDGKTYTAIRSEKEGFETRGQNDYTWRGYIDGRNDWSVTLSILDKAISGLMFTPDGVYEIRTEKDFAYKLTKSDQNSDMHCGGGILPPPATDQLGENLNISQINRFQNSQPLTTAEPDANTIDLIVVYTPAVRNALGVTQTENFINEAIQSVNTAYIRSNLNTRLRLVRAQEVNFTESGRTQRDILDNYMNRDQTIANLRNTYKADLVSLLIENCSNCATNYGIAYTMDNPLRYDSDSYYSVVLRSKALNELVFAHEINHNLGCNHDPNNVEHPRSALVYPFAYGNFASNPAPYSNNNFRTIMSYNKFCEFGCPVIPYFSSPLLTYNGQPTGVADYMDNRRVIENTTYTVANHKDTSGCLYRPGEAAVFTPHLSANELTAFQYAYVTGSSFLLGCPNAAVRTDGFTSFAGTVSHYQTTTTGDIEYHTNGSRAGKAFALIAPFYNKWKSYGFDGNNPLGYPIGFISLANTNSCNGTQNRYQSFEGGSLSQHLSGSFNSQIFEVHGAIHRKWELKLFAVCPLGLPTSNETIAQPSGATGSTGVLNQFQGGQIYWKTNASEAYEVHGSIYNTYVGLGGSASWLGFPTSDEFVSSGFARSNFEGGYITTTDGVNYRAFPTSGCPTSASVSPTNGQVGTPVTISGNNFTGVNSVKFTNNIAAQFTINSSTQISATVPSGATSGSITIGKTNCSNVQTNSFTVSVPSISVTVQTSPSWLSFTVDGTTYTSSQTFNWTPGSSHSISTTSTQNGTSGTRYSWSSWSDGGAISHTISPSSASTYTANFTTQYQLTTSANPSNGGSVSPSSGNWYNAGQQVQISATPSSGYTFGGWTGSGSGSYSGTNNPASITMNSPISQTANFTQSPSSSIQFSAANYNINENGGTATITVNRTGGTSPVGVNYSTSNGTAIAGSDYNSANGTLNFATGETSKTFNVSIIDETNSEVNETINLGLSNPTGGATLGSPGTAVLTIADNDSCTYSIGQGTTNPELTAFQNAYTAGGGEAVLGCATASVRLDGFTSFTNTIGHYQTTANGRIEYLSNGNSQGQAFSMLTPFVTKRDSFGLNSNNPLGYPVEVVSQTSTSCLGTQYKIQRFEGGSIVQHLSGTRINQLFEAHGWIHSKWRQNADTVCALGLPISDEKPAPVSGATGRSGVMSEFEGGNIYFRYGDPGTNIVKGAIKHTYISLNGSAGWLGFPQSDEYILNGRPRSDFEAGYITTTDGINYEAHPYGLQYYPLAYPIRLLDTRSGQPACYPGPGFTGYEQIKTQPARVPCQGLTIPATAQAIVGTVSALNTPNQGNLRLYPAGEELTPVSNVNFIPGRTVSNSFTVKLGTNGAFNIYSFSPSDVIIDVTGYYAPPATGGLYYHQLPNPIRILETRPGEAGYQTPGVPLAANSVRLQQSHLSYLGVTIPASAKAVTGNATVVNSTANAATGKIKLYPGDIAADVTTESINYVAGQTIPNAFTVRLDSAGQFKIHSSTQTHFLIDITGYYSTEPAADQNGSIGLLFNILPKPFRLLDTRAGETACDAPGAMLSAQSIRVQTVRGRQCSEQTIPSTAKAIFGNGTVVNNFTGAGSGNIRLYPGEQPLANASNLNYAPEDVIPNSFIVGLGTTNGAMNIYSFSRTHFIVDVSGYFAP
jgi:uncharacterized protein with LGFP repeats